MKKHIKTIIAPFSEYEDTIYSIRNEVFVIGQNVPPEREWDGSDEGCTHVLAKADNNFAGTGRIILKDGHIGRMAVLEQFRGMGIGSLIMQKLIDIGKENGLTRFYLGGQIRAIPFYEKLGFVPYGNEFMDAGIPHIYMELIVKRNR